MKLKLALNHLCPRSKWNDLGSLPHVGEVVLVSDDNIKRGQWPLAKIEEVHLGRDRLARTVTVKMKGKLTTRPIQRIHRLEVR